MPHAPKCKGYILSCAILMVSICMCGGGVVNVCSHTDWATEHQNQTKNKTL